MSGAPQNESVDVVLTRRFPEVRSALTVVHDTFCEAGYMTPRPSGVRMIPAYLNPGTAFVLGRAAGRPVAASALVVDGPFGLPSDRAFVEEMDDLRGTARLVEVGSLGILADARRHSRDLITKAFAATLRFLRDRPDGTAICISVEPEGAAFYERSFALERLATQERPLYGAPAALLSARVETIERAIAELGGAHRRAIRQMADEPAPAWLTDHRDSCEAWPAAQVGELLAESGDADRLVAQRELSAPALQAIGR